ncbi:MAG: hypothetical protein M3O82_03245 [Verrucomicrobiota bacterium]|nr:hypothetical protein [Verrucomicrobiota bacterium]
MKRKKIVVMGFMGGCPIAGVVWQHIHYIVGLQKLGHDVYYVEDSARLPYNPVTFEVTNDFTYAAEILAKLATQFGFENRWAFCARYLPDHDSAGLPKTKIVELYRDADAILNVCGTQEFNDDLLQSERILYVESDPGVEQIKVDSGDPRTLDYLQRHRALFSFGENVGTDAFPVPSHGLRWLPTRQPVVTELWKSDTLPPGAAMFTSIANWNTSGKKDIVWRGENYLWSKSIEFLKFVEAPERSGERFELATDIEDEETRSVFLKNGWVFRTPHDLSIDHSLYKNYIQNSKGEFTVAKDQYVRLNTGWFSDRSACYLAAGRPVITQQTGFTAHYGQQRGLFAFESLDEISDAVKMINADYKAHARAASEIAHDYFEAEKVLADLLDRAGV